MKLIKGGRASKAAETVDLESMSARALRRSLAEARGEIAQLRAKFDMMSLVVAVLVRKHGGTGVLEDAKGVLLRGELHLPAPQTMNLPPEYTVKIEPAHHGTAVVCVTSSDYQPDAEKEAGE